MKLLLVTAALACIAYFLPVAALAQAAQQDSN
jgi:hypothetical protein